MLGLAYSLAECSRRLGLCFGGCGWRVEGFSLRYFAPRRAGSSYVNTSKMTSHAVVFIMVTDVMDDAMDDVCSSEIVMMICSGWRIFDNVKKVNIVGLTWMIQHPELWKRQPIILVYRIWEKSDRRSPGAAICTLPSIVISSSQ